MPDPTFETLLSRQLREYAEAGVRPIDRFAIAAETIASGRTMPRWRRGWGLAPMRRNRILIPLLVGLLLAALAAGALLVGSRLMAPKTLLDTGVSIFVRRDDGPEPGVSIVAVRPDGGEVLVRKVPDSIVPGLGVRPDYSTVSGSGWLALQVVEALPFEGLIGPLGGGSWPMLLLDLGDEQATPWEIHDANLGGIGPRWGPTGLVAADAGGNGDVVVVADPKTHTTRIVSMRGGLVGGGPYIVWSADGSGIVGSTESGAYHVVPVDGGDPRPGVGGVFDTRGDYGPGLAELRICEPFTNCPGAADGRIERVELDGTTRTIWQQVGNDRALAAEFGSRADEYWLSVDHDQGRQVALVHLHDGREDTVATVNRDAAWQYVGAPTQTPGESAVVVQISVGDEQAALLVPLSGAPPTFHTGRFAGFVDRAAAVAFVIREPWTPAATMPAAGAAYALPSLDELIAAEQGLNPGRTVLGKASREAVDGDTIRRTYEVTRDKPGAGSAYLDCIGPSSVTVSSGANTTTSPCLRAGAYGSMTDATGPITVSASGDTSWRVVIYSP